MGQDIPRAAAGLATTVLLQSRRASLSRGVGAASHEAASTFGLDQTPALPRRFSAMTPRLDLASGDPCGGRSVERAVRCDSFGLEIAVTTALPEAQVADGSYCVRTS